MIEAKPPPDSLRNIIEIELDSLGFMPTRSAIMMKISDLMVEYYKQGYLHGVSDEITGDVRMENS